MNSTVNESRITAVKAIAGVNSSLRMTAKCQKDPKANMRGIEFLREENPKSELDQINLGHTRGNSRASVDLVMLVSVATKRLELQYLKKKYLFLEFEFFITNFENSVFKTPFPCHELD